jgi:hypothetical protein
MQAKTKRIGKDKTEEKSGRRGENISLAPLTPEAVLSDLLRVRPQPKPQQKRKSKGK